MENKIKTVTQQYRQEKWANIISERNASGLSIKEWCRNNNVKETAYYYWQRRIRHSIIESFAQQNVKKEDITFVPMLSNSFIDSEGSEKAIALLLQLNQKSLSDRVKLQSSLIIRPHKI